MKAEIQKILQMNKAGTITDEQAAELLAALAIGARDQKPEEGEGIEEEGERIRRAVGDGHWERFTDHAFTAADHAFRAFDHLGHHHMRRHMRHGMRHGRWGGRHGHWGENWGDSADGPVGDNGVIKSQFDAPRGERFVFKDNGIECSHVSDLELRDAEVTGNLIRASRVKDLRIEAGKLVNGSFLASSIEGLSLQHGEMSETRVRASKWRDIQIIGESAIRGLQINACAIEDLSLGGKSTWTGSTAHGIAIKGMSITDSTLNDLGLMAAHFRDVSITGCKMDKLLMRGVGFKDAAFVDCTLRDVFFSGHGGWKWRRPRFEDVRFEHCTLEKVVFTDCHFNKTSIRNVTLQDLQIRGVDLSGQEIDGNEAFLKAIGKG